VLKRQDIFVQILGHSRKKHLLFFSLIPFLLGKLLKFSSVLSDFFLIFSDLSQILSDVFPILSDVFEIPREGIEIAWEGIGKKSDKSTKICHLFDTKIYFCKKVVRFISKILCNLRFSNPLRIAYFPTIFFEFEKSR